MAKAKKQIGIIGLGNMGTAVAQVIASNGHNILGWSIEKPVVKEINAKNTNEKYLKNVKLNKKIKATDNLGELLGKCNIVFITTPSKYIKSTLKPYRDFFAKRAKHMIIVNCAKGLVGDGMVTCSKMLSVMLPKNKIVVMSGPSIANEFSCGLPGAVTIAGKDSKILDVVAKVLETNNFCVSKSSDLIGTELGGILKNIYALGLGMIEGQKGICDNFRGIYFSKVLKEMTLIAKKLGAKKEAMLNTSGIGDLITTCLSESSHNRSFGKKLGQCKVEVLPEGCNTTKMVIKLAKKKKIKVPISIAIDKVINCKMKIDGLIKVILRA